MRKTVAFLWMMLMFGCVSASWAQVTAVTVRAKANDAKFIGTAMSGVQASITDAITGELLAQGRIMGGTGSTDTLMKQPMKRGQLISNDSSAAFVAKLDIEEPKRVNVRVHGPLAAGGTSVDASKSIWVIPGHDILGDGIVFNLYGFVLVPLTPHANTKVKVKEPVNLSLYVTMLCGCAITPGGIWNADQYEVEAWIWNGDDLVEKVPMRVGSEAGLFSADFTPESKGNYRITYIAADGRNNNYAAAYSGMAVK